MKIDDKYLVFDPTEIEVLGNALLSKQLSGTSQYIELYEKKLSEFFGIKYAIAVSSGSAALHAALYSLGVRDGDEILIPAISPIPTVLPIITSHAIPKLVDTDPMGFGFDIDDLKRKITKKTKAAMLVPLWGYPIDYDPILRILKQHNMPLIEDAAQAHGTRVRGKYVGTFGDIGCFSTHDRKILSTGEGGFILTNREDVYKTVKKFIQLGTMDGTTYGVNYKLSTLQAALGMHRIKQIPRQIGKRKKNKQLLMELLSRSLIQELPVIKDGEPNYYSLVLYLPWGKLKNQKFIDALASKGIPSDILRYDYKPIYERPLFSSFTSDCPNALSLLHHITTIPVHPKISIKEIHYMAAILKSTAMEV